MKIALRTGSESHIGEVYKAEAPAPISNSCFTGLSGFAWNRYDQ